MAPRPKISEEELINQKFGKWTIIASLGRDSRSVLFVECLCDCGFKKVQRFSNIKQGFTKGCRRCYLKRRRSDCISVNFKRVD